jgi:flagella basal body P-ring formation protein FlgA
MTPAVLLMLAASMAATAGPAADAPSASSTSIEDVLQAELARRFPSVQRWTIRHFEGSGPSASIEGDAEVVRVGARSAVRVGGRLQWYAVSGFQNVLSARRSVGTGEALDASIARVEERDVLAANCEPLTELDALQAARARRPLREDQIICAQAVEPRPAVGRGQIVTVRYVGSRVTLQTRGIAKADGNVGETLVVRATQSDESFPATVSGAGEVTVHE